MYSFGQPLASTFCTKYTVFTGKLNNAVNIVITFAYWREVAPTSDDPQIPQATFVPNPL